MGETQQDFFWLDADKDGVPSEQESRSELAECPAGLRALHIPDADAIVKPLRWGRSNDWLLRGQTDTGRGGGRPRCSHGEEHEGILLVLLVLVLQVGVVDRSTIL